MNDLVENGASVGAEDKLGRTPLHAAARGGKTEMVSLMLLDGADKGSQDNSTWTPLYTAVRYDHAAAALALLAAGADANLRCGPLH